VADSLTFLPPPSQAQEHYTEELKLLPAHKMHQFYTGRLTRDGRSANDGLPAPEAAAYAYAKFGPGGDSGSSSGVVLSTKGRRRFEDLKLPLYGNWCERTTEARREKQRERGSRGRRVRSSGTLN